MKSKIIIFSSHRTLESGGVGTHLRHLITEINNNKIDNDVILGLSTLSLIKIKTLKFINRFFYNEDLREILYLNCYILELQNVLKSKLILIGSSTNVTIHCHDKYTAIAAMLLKGEFSNIKIIQTLHAPFSEQYKITHSNCKCLIEFAELIDIGANIGLDKIIGVDTLQTQIVENISNFESSKMIRVSNAVDTNQLDQLNDFNLIKKEFNIEKYFVIARHLQTKNGVIYAVKAFREFLKSNSDFALIIMGEGPEKESILGFIKENNIENKIKLVGRRSHSDSLSIIKNAFGSIIPSIPVGVYIEATSLTMLESMYLGVPVLASNIGGLAEVIKSKENGLLFKEKDFSAILENIKLIVEDSNLRDKIIKNSRETIVNDYSTTKWFKKINDFYEN